jgi:hypothetical protein
MTMTPRRQLVVLLSSCVLQVGCVELMGELFDSENSREMRRLEEREAELMQKVEARSKEERARIDTLKQVATESIDSGDLKKGLSALRSLHFKMHPCEGEPCTRHDSRDELLMEFMIENGTDREEAFVRAQLARAATRADELIAEERYAEVYPGVSAASYGFDAYAPERDRLLGIRDTTGAKWLASLDARAQATRDGYPALSMFYVLKASKVADEIGEDDRAREYAARASQLTRALRERNRLNVRIAGSIGALAESTTRAAAARETPLMAVTLRADPDANALLAMQASEPEYAVTSTQETGSFTYQEGTTSKPNPDFEELERKREISQRNYDDCKKACVDDSLFCFHNMYDGMQYRKVGVSACTVRDAALKEVADLNAKIASTPKTVEEPAYKSRSYPLTRHTQSGKSTLTYRVEFLRDGRVLQASKEISSALYDDEHDAHSYKGGGVGASGRDVPSQASVYAELEKAAASWLFTELDEVNAAFLEGLADADPADPELRADSIILLDVLAKDGAPVPLLRELDRITGVSDASELLIR